MGSDRKGKSKGAATDENGKPVHHDDGIPRPLIRVSGSCGRPTGRYRSCSSVVSLPDCRAPPF